MPLNLSFDFHNIDIDIDTDILFAFHESTYKDNE
jgi:hypothetical protein